MAGIPEDFAMVHEAQSGVTVSAVSIGAGATVNTMQHPRLKAPAPPPPQSTTPRPSTSANPTSPTGAVPTSAAGQSGASTTPMAAPMDTDGEQQDDTMGAQSISSASTSSIATTIVMEIESMMWDSMVSKVKQCTPVVLQQLIEAEFDRTENAPQHYTNNNEHLKVLTMISSTATVQRDRFIPTAAMYNTNNYLWFTWLTKAQYNDFKATGQVPGNKDTRGDNAHKHHRLHNSPDHCIKLHIYTRWNAAMDNTNYGVNKPIYLLVWETSINNILANSHAKANAHAGIYFRRAEDVSIEFNPVFNGQDPMNFNMQALLGKPIGVWTMDDWHRIDNNASTILRLDHSISA
eukprot:959371-Amphidinium_carterae.1